jgi:conjugal transfer pilus assembly protein TrbC
MPNGLIESIAKDAKRYHMPLVIRGLIENDFKQTMTRLFAIEKKIQVPVLIDPLWFKTFGVTRAPALVLVVEDHTCKAGRPCEDDQFEVFYGSLAVTEKLQLLANQSTIVSTLARSMLNAARKEQS